MAPRRRPWGSRNDPVALGYEVERPVRDKLRAIADNMGVATSVLIEQMVEHLELTDQGIPAWWEPLPRDDELAMPAAEEGSPITST
ncbi:hypothetical protein SAMN05216418_0129 [Microbacterium enclense]|uniref:Uncharacterized protein n=1 Tax=Microbacterium enclense TaxID=993073 RepID=A0A1G6RIE5_9MICO|nr:hypothetical protein AS029_16265 [Microbacterium enclense]SDD03757.1 hypothetical protein SAMN05216418_0129 [Microbacterium enclense]